MSASVTCMSLDSIRGRLLRDGTGSVLVSYLPCFIWRGVFNFYTVAYSFIALLQMAPGAGALCHGLHSAALVLALGGNVPFLVLLSRPEQTLFSFAFCSR